MTKKKNPPPRAAGPAKGELTCEFRISGASLPVVTCGAYPAQRAAPRGPALCYAHRRQSDFEATTARFRGVDFESDGFDLGAAGELLGGLLGGIFGDRFKRPAPSATAAPPAGMTAELARVVMRFGPVEQLTAEGIKERRRELAREYHPDRAGGAAAATAAMQQVNAAAERLLMEV